MNKNYTLIKWLIFAALVFFSIVAVTPPKEKIRLGLDLAGGTSFTVQVDEEAIRRGVKADNPDMADAAVETTVAEQMREADARAVEVLRSRVDSLGVNEPLIAPTGDHRVLVQLPGANEEQRDKAEESLRNATVFLEFRMAHKDSLRLVDERIFAAGKAPDGYEIYDAGDRKYLRRTKDYEDLAANDPDYASRVATFETPAPRYSLLLEPELLKSGEKVYTPWFIKNAPEKVTGAMIRRAAVDRDPMSGKISISLEFRPEGRKAFADLTSRYALYSSDARDPNPRNADGTSWHLAIVMNNIVYSAPVINTPIPNGRAQITGAFTAAEAAQLRNVLNAGALSTPLKVLEKRMVDPTLGADTIKSGIRASIIAGIVVAIFMLVYYMYLGVVADIALALDLILLPVGMILAGGILSVFGRDAASAAGGKLALPVLTMPGIAGIVLTIGMAVDANVLIFERIREEFAAGKSAAAAVAGGFKGAATAIADSNITTILTGIILFCFGSGPIRGFAVTLIAGIIVSMYTALVVLRMIFDATVSQTRVKPYRMLQAIKAPKFDFIGKRRPAFLFSGAVIVLTIAAAVVTGLKNPARIFTTDFVGGTTVSLNYTARPDSTTVIEDALKGAGLSDVRVQYQKDAGGMADSLCVTTSDTLDRTAKFGDAPIGSFVEDTLQKNFPDSGFSLKGEEMIGASVGADLKKGACLAIIFAWIGIILYITIRFEWGFAMGAVAALIHDVLFTAGIYFLCGRQFSLTTVAALLTIVGYSVNDTIVIFDRIRSDVRLDQRTPFIDICNRSINQTLNRTIITSVTTILAVLLLLVFGGGSIFDFALCLLIGMLAGTYSSVFLSAPIMLACYKGRRPGFLVKK